MVPETVNTSHTTLRRNAFPVNTHLVVAEGHSKPLRLCEINDSWRPLGEDLTEAQRHREVEG